MPKLLLPSMFEVREKVLFWHIRLSVHTDAYLGWGVPTLSRVVPTFDRYLLWMGGGGTYLTYPAQVMLRAVLLLRLPAGALSCVWLFSRDGICTSLPRTLITIVLSIPVSFCNWLGCERRQVDCSPFPSTKRRCRWARRPNMFQRYSGPAALLHSCEKCSHLKINTRDSKFKYSNPVHTHIFTNSLEYFFRTNCG